MQFDKYQVEYNFTPTDHSRRLFDPNRGGELEITEITDSITGLPVDVTDEVYDKIVEACFKDRKEWKVKMKMY